MSTFELCIERDGIEYLYNPYLNDYFPINDATKEIAEISKTARRNFEFEKKFLLHRLSLAENNPNADPSQKQKQIDKINDMLSKYNMSGETAPGNMLAVNESITRRGDNTFLVGFESSFNANFDTGTALIYKILCPTKIGGDATYQVNLTSTNRATYGAETLILYGDGQSELDFRAWDWSPGLPFPPWGIIISYSSLGDYLAHDTIREIGQQFILVYSETSRDSANNWRNLIYLFNYRLQAYDKVYDHPYSALDSDQKNGNAWWGPFLETSNQNQFHGTNIVGFDQTYFASRNSSNVWSTPQLLSDTQSWLWGPPDHGFNLVYFYANHSFTLTTPAMAFTPGISGGGTAGTFTLGIDRGLSLQMGSLRYVFVHLVISSISGSPTGDLVITGLPIQPKYESPLTLGIMSSFTADMSSRYITPMLMTDGTIRFFSCGTGAETRVSVDKVSVYSTIHVAGLFIADI